MRSIASASSTVARRTPTSAVCVEPVGDPPGVLDTVFRFTTTGEVMIVLGETHENGLFPEDLERREELLGLFDRTPQIPLRVEDQERRLHVRHVGQRRAEDELFALARSEERRVGKEWR